MVLTIRRAQMDVFVAAARERFVNEMVEHVKRYFPSQYRKLGDAGLRNTLTETVHKAKTYGFSSKRDVCKFINVAMMFGPDFDRSLPLFPTILAGPEHPSIKARRLSEASLAIYKIAKDRQERDTARGK
jgi:hypothetical protein